MELRIVLVALGLVVGGWTLPAEEPARTTDLPLTTDAPKDEKRNDESNKIFFDGSQLFRVSLDKIKVLNELEEKGDIENWGKNKSSGEFFVSKDKVEAVKKHLEDHKIHYEILIEDVQRAINDENPLTDDDIDELVGRKGHRMTWQAYHRLQDIYGYLDYLAQTYPKTVSVGTLGTSVEGRPLKYVKISSGAPNAKAFWIDGGIHAREWISPSSVTYIISELVENRDAHLAAVDGIDYYILPVMNPDGYEYTHTVNRLWRKNRSKYGYCDGADLNRNWGYKWGGKGSSKFQCKEIYGGSRAFSEPETQSVSNFILTIPNTKGFVTFHSYGQYILYPYGYDTGRPAPDQDDLERVGRLMSQNIAATTGAYYTVGNSANTLYPASGGADDWAKGVANIKYTYTVELRDQGRHGFILPASLILPTAKEAFASIKTISSEIRKLS